MSSSLELIHSLLNKLCQAKTVQKDINIYTHKLHVDGIGSSALMILTAWRNNSFTRPQTDLFPPKLAAGLNGHRLTVLAFEQPPFVVRQYAQTLQTLKV